VSEIVDRADRALLVSKSGGRNQVTISRTAA
jgi:PleD family two-component response regulator